MRVHGSRTRWRSRSRAKNIDIANRSCWDTCCSKEYSDAKEAELLKKRDKIKEEMDALGRSVQRQRDTWQPLVAFVSFDTEEDYEAALEDQEPLAMGWQPGEGYAWGSSGR